ncbi:MAG: L,D-transpeptidase family protein [Actinobacteria bacterium]|nr:L,D-transpeptidase family protein [Actinomycetota bacterium]
MRRLALAALAALACLAFACVRAPSASAAGPCGLTSTPVVGSAPLRVTFTATCASASYAWAFGDGAVGVGQSVEHTYPAGSFHPTLTTDAGADTAPAVTAISLSLRVPAVARYAQWVTLHASVTPNVPVTLRGRRFVAGKLRVRVLGTSPYVAEALGVRSAPAHTVVIPKLVVRVAGSPVVGSRLRVIATLHPANAGKVVAPHLVDTRTAHLAHVMVRTRPAHGWQAVRGSATVAIVQPNLALGSSGPSVRALEDRLAELHYAIKRDGFFGSEDLEAVYAFQKVERLDRTGTVDAALWARLLRATVPAARYPGDHVEVDKTRQVLFIVRGGKVTLTVATSTGATGNTPLGLWHVYRKVGGFDWVLYYPSYFLRGFAVHGYPDVPPYPASHGCARIPMWIAQTVYAQIGYGSAVYVYA